MSILPLVGSESLLLAVLILVVAFARRLPPKWGALAAAVLASAALIVEIYGIGLMVENGEAAAAAAANRQVNIAGRNAPNEAANLPVQTKVPDNGGDQTRAHGKPK